MLRRISGMVLLAVLGLVASTATSPPASATGEPAADFSITGGVLYGFDDCPYREVAVTVTLPQADYEWRLTINVIGPSGKRVGSESLWEYGEGTYHDEVSWCGDGEGTYTVRSKATYTDGDQNVIDFDVPDQTFQMRYARIRTRLRVSDTNPSPGDVVRLHVRARIEAPNGYIPASSYPVHIQYRHDGRWFRVRGLKGVLSFETGSVTLRAVVNRRVTIRARTIGDYLPSSNSAPVTLR